MTTEPNVRVETENAAPFKPGDLVEHGAGVRIVVKACTLQVQHARTLWIIDGEDGNRYFAKNSKLVGGGSSDTKLEPGTINDQGSFEPTTPLGKLFGREGRFVPAENAKPYDPVAELKSEIETLAKQRDEAREELKEATAEFVRALSAANSERDTARRVAEYERASAIGWREVVVTCGDIMKLNGKHPTDPKSSAVPLQLEHRLKSLALAENVIRDASKVLARKAT